MPPLCETYNGNSFYFLASLMKMYYQTVAWRDLCDWVFYQKLFGCGWMWLLEPRYKYVEIYSGFLHVERIREQRRFDSISEKKREYIINKHIIQ